MTTNQEQLALIERYKALGWEFTYRDYGIAQHQWEIQSPRILAFGEWAYLDLKEPFDELTLLREESELYAWETHGDAITAALHKAGNGLASQIALLYRLKDQGKLVEIPERISIGNVEVELTKAPQ